MTGTIFNGLFDSSSTEVITVSNFLICMAVSLVLGLIFAGAYMIKNERRSASFIMTLVMLPVLVCVAIMMVNGNIGVGVAIAGIFGLVRFRSVPGQAKEIAAVFMAMASGLIVGTGYIAYAVLFTVLMAIITIVLNSVSLKYETKRRKKILRVTIPEDLDYTEIFNDIWKKYADSVETVSAKTVDMGSMFRLTYRISLKDEKLEKKMIDEIRVRNGNLEVGISTETGDNYEL